MYKKHATTNWYCHESKKLNLKNESLRHKLNEAVLLIKINDFKGGDVIVQGTFREYKGKFLGNYVNVKFCGFFF